MARAIDGELLELEIANIANKLAKSDAQKALMGRVMYCVEHMPTLTPQNEPLTLEELREMDEPVWVACKPIEGGNGYWCLCQHGHIITPAGSIYNVKEIPHWVFYRRPPEGEADA
jgi:hypothetical protein